MTTARPRRHRVGHLGDDERQKLYLALLNDQRLPDTPRNDVIGHMFEFNSRGLRESLWAERGAQVLEAWAVLHPGARPSTWWLFAAPRLPLSFIEKHPEYGPWVCREYHEPRLQVGGDGRRWESSPDVKMGFPTDWRRVNPEDPPLMESSAAYLRRFGLLLTGETARLSKAHYMPVQLPEQFWPRDREAAA